MNFQSRITHQSQLPGFEGVSFTLHKLTEGRRLKMRVSLAEPAARMRDLMAEVLAADTKPEAERAALATRLGTGIREVIDSEVTPAWVRGLLVSVEGLTIDDQPATVESLIEQGPRDLYREIALVVRAEAGLTERDQGESAPPTTSDALEGGRMNDTSATPAAN